MNENINKKYYPEQVMDTDYSPGHVRRSNILKIIGRRGMNGKSGG